MNIREIMKAAPVMPVLAVERLEQAVPLAQALVAGGLPVLEVTLRTPVALEAIQAMAREVPKAIIGVGTVTRPEELEQAQRAGAVFAVSPGLTPELARAGGQSPIPFLPGVMTPSEVMSARAMGYTALKLFPAQQAGGVGMLKAVYGPLPDMVFCPTGGVSLDNMGEFLALPNVLCVGGSWVAPKGAVDGGDWEGITRLARQAVERAGR